MDQTLDDGTKTAKPKSNSTSKSDCIKGAKNVCRKSKDSEDDTTSEKCNDGDDKHVRSLKCKLHFVVLNKNRIYYIEWD